MSLAERLPLRWDNLDRVIIGVGLVICTISAVLGGIGCLLEERHAAEYASGNPDFYSFTPLMLDYGFSAIVVGWLILLIASVIYYGYAPVASARLPMSLIYAAFGWIGLHAFMVGLYDMFIRGMRSVM
ncbi:MAG: hypothetical protein AAGB29_00315 [Planctomycetota bacterium]